MLAEAHAYRPRGPGTGRSGPSRCPSREAATWRSARCGRAISRGTETLAFRAVCRRASTRAMRAPFQEGDFPDPVKYGYLNVGAVEAGAARAARPHALFA